MTAPPARSASTPVDDAGTFAALHRRALVCAAPRRRRDRALPTPARLVWWDGYAAGVVVVVDRRRPWIGADLGLAGARRRAGQTRADR